MAGTFFWNAFSREEILYWERWRSLLNEGSGWDLIAWKFRSSIGDKYCNLYSRVVGVAGDSSWNVFLKAEIDGRKKKKLIEWG